MTMTDPIADMLTRVRNANQAYHDSVSMPSSTLKTRIAHFWSRSRSRLWKKGEESGNLLEVREVRTDCDQDALWLKVAVAGAGVACHTGERSCFYRRLPLRGPTGADLALERA